MVDTILPNRKYSRSKIIKIKGKIEETPVTLELQFWKPEGLLTAWKLYKGDRDSFRIAGSSRNGGWVRQI